MIPAPPPNPPPGRLLRGADGEVFQIVGELGRGGMGVVYRAWDPQASREVALKVALEPEGEATRRARFRREGEITAALVHPGIVRVHAAGEIEGRPYLAYELVEGARTLEEVLASAGSDVALDLLEQTARALGYAHAHGVVHRDVKPENVLVDARGQARVADFGLAVAQNVERLTQTGTWLGTPNYTAPEQLHSTRDGVGPPADVWSLGVMLYETLTGELPFVAPSLLELGARISSGSFERPRDLAPGVSPALEAVCVRALRTRAEDRFADGTAFADAVVRARAGYAPSGGRRRGWIGIALVALLVGAAGLLARQRAAETAPPPPAAEVAPDPATLLAEASAAVAASEPNAALAALRPLLGKDASPEALALAARARLALAAPDDALDLLERIPPCPERWLLELEAAALAEDPERALAAAAQLPTGQREVALWRGRAHLIAGDYDAAARDLEGARAAGDRVDGDLVAVEVARRLADLVEVSPLVHTTVPAIEPRLRMIPKLPEELNRMATRLEAAASRLGAFRQPAFRHLQGLLWQAYPILFEVNPESANAPALERFERLEPSGRPADALRVLIAWCHRYAAGQPAPIDAALGRIRGPLGPRVAFVGAALRIVNTLSRLNVRRKRVTTLRGALDELLECLAGADDAYRMAPPLPTRDGVQPADVATRNELTLMGWLCDAVANGYETAAWEARADPARFEELRRRALVYAERVLEFDRVAYGEARDEDDHFRVARLHLLGGEHRLARQTLTEFADRRDVDSVWVPSWETCLAECDLQAGALDEAVVRIRSILAMGAGAALVDPLTTDALLRALRKEDGSREALVRANKLRSQPRLRWRSVAETLAQIEGGWTPGGLPFMPPGDDAPRRKRE